jgi:hypothetical protein
MLWNAIDNLTGLIGRPRSIATIFCYLAMFYLYSFLFYHVVLLAISSKFLTSVQQGLPSFYETVHPHA